MATVRLVRHGEAAAGWGADLDPGLSAVGHDQARAAADALDAFGPVAIVSSPLRRTQETAAPLAQRWATTVQVDPDVGEVASPTSDLDERAAWLKTFLPGVWAGQPAQTIRWRDALVGAVAALAEDTMVFTHFVAINAVIATVTDDNRVTVFRPGYCSVTTLDVTAGRIEVVDLGGQAVTAVR
ncbi:MAG: histidine phosphatase family protein [Acidimicrobiales bacterium]